MEQIVGLLFQILALYFLAGLVFGLIFILGGLSRMDSAAKGAGWRFRLILLPGIGIFWPLLAVRWLKGQREAPMERGNSHRDGALKP